MKPFGVVTRGTTNPNRLRRVDNFIAYRCGAALARAAVPLVVDLGYGATPVTTVELRARLARTVRPDVAVVGLEIDPARVAAARAVADPPLLEFRRGGFELAGLRPVVVRAFNVLRQYPEAEVTDAWRAMTSALAPGGLLVEGTCDELGRVACWACVDASGPSTLTLSAGAGRGRVSTSPSMLMPWASLAPNRITATSTGCSAIWRAVLASMST